MRLEVYRHLWGLEDDPARMAAVLPAVAAAGYDGVAAAPVLLSDAGPFREALAETGLRLVAQAFTFGRRVEDHVDSLRRQLALARDLGATKVVCQSGRDSFSDDDAERFFAGALVAEDEGGLVVGHETHRGRILFNPWRTGRLLERFEALKLNCDYSHWVVVAERLLDHEGDILARCAERAVHIDARVGFEEGPQVSDPRAPEHARHLAAHEAWWDGVWSAQRRAGVAVSTLTPEFGPPPYQPTLPYTGAAVADTAAVVDWMTRRLRARFGGQD